MGDEMCTVKRMLAKASGVAADGLLRGEGQTYIAAFAASTTRFTDGMKASTRLGA